MRSTMRPVFFGERDFKRQIFDAGVYALMTDNRGISGVYFEVSEGRAPGGALRASFDWTALPRHDAKPSAEPWFEVYLECTRNGVRDYYAFVSPVANNQCLWGKQTVTIPVPQDAEKVYVGVRTRNPAIATLLVRNFVLTDALENPLKSPQQLDTDYAAFREKGWYSNAFMENLHGACAVVYGEVLKNGGDSFDIGANLGVHTKRLVAWAKKNDAKVVALEPNPGVYKRLMSAFTPEDAKYLIALEAGADEQELPKVPFFYSEEHHELGSLNISHMEANFPTLGASAKEVFIQTRTIDAMVEEYQLDPKFVKIDVEGRELNVLRGGFKTLTTKRPVVAFEFNASASSDGGWGIFELFLNLGYVTIDCFGNLLTAGTWSNPLAAPIDRYALPIENAQSLASVLAPKLQDFWERYATAERKTS